VVFELVRFVGAGKFAWVFEAKAPSGERAAIKMLCRDDTQAVRRFQREIKIMQQLPVHPNCVQYRGHGQAKNHPWVAMDFIDGFTLGAILRSAKAIPERTACQLMAQLCDGFEGLHKLGLTHRDIKPENIMITHADRQVKLMDFGLVQDSQGLLQLYEQADILSGKDFLDDLDAGLIAGTPEFMAPEQILDPHEKDRTRQKTDTPADVFALGTIFYQLVSGTQLFPYDKGSKGASGKQGLINYLDWRVRLGEDAIVCPSNVPTELWTIIRKSLLREPKMRQRNATELGADLRFYMETGQGVLEDDMSATIAQTFDLARLRSIASPLSTAEFASIKAAVAESEAEARRKNGPRIELASDPDTIRERALPPENLPITRGGKPRPDRGHGKSSDTVPERGDSGGFNDAATLPAIQDSTTARGNRFAPSRSKIEAARRAHSAAEMRAKRGRVTLYVVIGAIVVAGGVLAAFLATQP
jgi:serine/threonine protein kinase